ncbi:MAG: transcriptional regulator, TraR/DksA family [Thermomicrobiales bacterium]|nr:transcriptional regulator, TraR/DksA family [Thermomicrobiales bacterium]MDF2757416.1 transcriptional regulator, TraR/DksA family [Thermomicrobiales bacterium]MDF3015077.1 transcriptional regulator, TraR/DksA family [Thermomicrobiales bacterium]
MNKRQQDTLRKRLEERRAEIEDDMSYMAAEMRSIGVDQDEENGSLGNHIADDGSNVAEAERIVTVSEDLQQILVQVNGALERMNNGNYGVCQRCGKLISKERLEAFPYVAYCIDCQSLVERDQALRAGA